MASITFNDKVYSVFSRQVFFKRILYSYEVCFDGLNKQNLKKIIF